MPTLKEKNKESVCIIKEGEKRFFDDEGKPMQGDILRNNGMMIMRFSDGYLHSRKSVTGRLIPSVEVPGKYMEWRSNGLLDRPVKEGPAIVSYEKGINEYWEKGTFIKWNRRK